MSKKSRCPHEAILRAYGIESVKLRPILALVWIERKLRSEGLEVTHGELWEFAISGDGSNRERTTPQVERYLWALVQFPERFESSDLYQHFSTREI